MSAGMGMGRVRDAALGLGYLGLVLAIVVGTWAAYNQVFTSRSDITLTTGTLGNALQKGSDVKLNGVPVGTVSEIEPRDGGATLTLALQPDVLDQLPADTTARLLPKTLFGERYVALIRPGEGGTTLEAGDTIHQDASSAAVELEEVFDELLPVLQAIQPDKLSAMLGELAQMLRGRGGEMGDTVVAWGQYLHKLNPLTPKLADDLAALGKVAQNYADAAPDLIDALDSMRTTSQTLVDQRTQVSDLFAGVITAADDTNGWMVANSDTIISLSRESRRALEAVSPYAVQFPCLFKALRDFIPVMDKTLGKGTKEPGMHVVLNVTPSRGRYVVGKDDPRYRSTGAPRCPYQDGSVKPVRSRASAGAADDGQPERILPPPSARVQQTFADGAGLGEVNSPAENQLIAELMAPAAGVGPADYPAWGSLLVGPLLRGAEVEVR
ncbi:MCE family protein [Pimelobacter simplex]|uniref:MCE-family protein Mce1A n=1 Tax=Nocardioides simplex TaxID=2045 RepID=A0A0A1DIE7_NOCSI|nr:MCE family protein [Pimelobacter simplex]AIY16417.1 MCE-family protein Mce1A [Pimelobacter simplex]MCG8152910.1 MCE family protein [Pimelobacter simplex]GEB11878.1 ABC transporter substrate-binding protein [Pimelobacter simplex]SFN02948.1 phospholipid/cholesterol/gamma-HCH transport system substrate-binding protein [Pimelobacter simplex]